MTYSRKSEDTSTSEAAPNPQHSTLNPGLTPETSKHLQTTKKSPRDRLEKSAAKPPHEVQDANERPALLGAALWYAGRGLPVFPLHWVDDQSRCSCGKVCGRAGKHPLIPNGHLGATTDPRQIRRWLSRWPDANLGIPTGVRSGLLVLDVDQPASLDALEAEHGRLPATRTHSTGSGGVHYLFGYPSEAEIRNSAGKLAPGLDVRAEGGYIVAPPSITKEPYEVLDDLPLAEPPEWLLEHLREPSKPVSSGEDAHSPGPTPPPDGGLIKNRTRNNTLTSIAGRLNDGSRDLAALTADLLSIRNARCENPETFPDDEVRKIARSIHPRPPCKRTGPVPTPEVLETLKELEARVLWGREWRGMGGKSERDAYVALLEAARKHGEMISAGVRVSIGVRTWALAAAVSRRTMHDYSKGGERKPGIITRLKLAGLIRSDNADRSETEAGAIVLLLPPRARFHHSSTGGEYLSTTSGETLRAPRLRWSAPVVERMGAEVTRSVIRRLGKGCGAVIDALERRGGEATIAEIAATLHMKRPRDARRRYVNRLEKTGVVECFGDTVALSTCWLDALNRAREIGGEIDAARRDMRRYTLEREAYRNRYRTGADRAPTRREMDERRWSRVTPSGRISELEREAEHFPDVFVDRGDAQVPLGERYTERKLRRRRMVRVDLGPQENPQLPTLGADGIYHHGPTCGCWLCGGSGALACVSFAGV